MVHVSTDVLMMNIGTQQQKFVKKSAEKVDFTLKVRVTTTAHQIKYLTKILENAKTLVLKTHPGTLSSKFVKENVKIPKSTKMVNVFLDVQKI